MNTTARPPEGVLANTGEIMELVVQPWHRSAGPRAERK